MSDEQPPAGDQPPLGGSQPPTDPPAIPEAVDSPQDLEGDGRATMQEPNGQEDA